MVRVDRAWTELLKKEIFLQGRVEETHFYDFVKDINLYDVSTTEFHKNDRAKWAVIKEAVIVANEILDE